jgi:hypothetical protein
VLKAVPARGSSADDVAAALEDYGMQVAPVRVVYRSTFEHALTIGESVYEYVPKAKRPLNPKLFTDGYVKKLNCKHG